MKVTKGEIKKIYEVLETEYTRNSFWQSPDHGVSFGYHLDHLEEYIQQHGGGEFNSADRITLLVCRREHAGLTMKTLYFSCSILELVPETPKVFAHIALNKFTRSIY